LPSITPPGCSRFVDPGFVYDALPAKTVGRIVLQAANEPLPQQHASEFADAVTVYLAEVKKLADTERKDSQSQQALLRDGVYSLAADPTKPTRPPRALDEAFFRLWLEQWITRRSVSKATLAYGIHCF